MGQDPFGELSGIDPEILGDNGPVLLSAILHMREAGLLVHWRSRRWGCGTHSTLTARRSSGR
ncbi:hypothetical protein D3C71_1946060 [compost metagenome]